MRNPILVAIVALAALSAHPGPARADSAVTVTFSSDEVRIIASWYDEHGHATDSRGKGKNKARGLPPGIAKNLSRGKALPPGIAKQQLPGGLIHALPAPPRGFERVIVDGRVLLVEVATQVIHDVLVDLVLR